MEEGAHAGATAVHDRSCLSCRVQRLIRRTICLCLTADRLFLQYAVCPAGIAQLVEHNLAKVGVASSSLVSRSRLLIDRHRRNGADRSHGLSGRVVMQRPAKPCTPVRFRPQPPFPASFTFPPRLSILPTGLDIPRDPRPRIGGMSGANTARVAELADAADSSGSPTRKRVGEQGSNSGNP